MENRLEESGGADRNCDQCGVCVHTESVTAVSSFRLPPCVLTRAVAPLCVGSVRGQAA